MIKRFLGNTGDKGPTGFTLLEVVVALGIFSIAVLLIVNSFAFVIQTQRLQAGQQELQEELRVMIELFHREARTARGDSFQATLLDDRKAVAFINQSGACVVWGLGEMSQVVRGVVPVDQCDLPHHLLDDQFLSVTDASGAIRFAEFRIQVHNVGKEGLVSGERWQGVIRLVVEAQREHAGDSVRVQSMVASRLLEY